MKLLGGILLGVGILIAGLSGLCSLLMMADPSFGRSDGWYWVAMFGGIPFAIGMGLLFLGRHLIKLGKNG